MTGAEPRTPLSLFLDTLLPAHVPPTESKQVHQIYWHNKPKHVPVFSIREGRIEKKYLDIDLNVEFFTFELLFLGAVIRKLSNP
jgi:hypothetical protein